MAESVNEQCRTCLLKENEMLSLLAVHVVCDKVMSVIELLKTCTSAQIDFEDGYPQFVCLNCIYLAEKSYKFRVQCEKVDETLRSQFNKITDNEDGCVISNDYLDDNDEISSDTYEVLQPEFENSDEDLCLNLVENKETIKCEDVDQIGFSCPICNLIFPTSAALAKHGSSAHPPNFFRCPQCSIRFFSQDLLDKHIAKHKNESKQPSAKQKKPIDYICAVCGKKYLSLSTLHIHIRKHSSGNQNSDNSEEFICQNCEQHFVTAADLQMHMETIHQFKIENSNQFKEKKKPDMQSKVLYMCKICSNVAKSLSEIKDHLTTHDVSSKSVFNHLLYKCSECSKSFGTIYDYFTHSSVHNSNKLENSSAGSRIANKKTYKCNIGSCDKAFPSPSALKKHSNTHESQWPKKCRYCDVTVQKRAEYVTHLNEQHDDKKTLICSQCGKKFFKERNLQNHMKTHSGERNYMCDFCGFSFHALNNLVAHRRIHTGVKPYKCTYCPQAFFQHAGLRSHLLNHIGEKKHECPTCRKKFLRIGALKSHIKIHTGVKDYACHICGAKFGASSTRKKHLLTHTGERNHVCDFCGKAFSRRSNLSVHRKIHTGETPHVCEVCGKGFIQAHVLRSHMNTHKKNTENKEMTSTTKFDMKHEESEEVTVLVDFNE